jgi:penicillin-binding protein 1A
MARRFGISGEISTYPSMVLGTSDVRLIDMTRAFASVQNRGLAVTPYAVRKVVTADGRLLYQKEREEERTLVAPWVAAEMTDLLQSAVLTGTGRAAQIGRPVAGKTGTTQSNKDGWFIGFSSGLTTGVWMGRDDAKPIGGLQGGTAPARAFHDFMSIAVARRPVEKFETDVPIPDWQLEPEEELFALPEDFGTQPLVDADGNPLPGVAQPTDPYGQPLPNPDAPQDQQWIERAGQPGSPRPGSQQPQQLPPQQQQTQPGARTLPSRGPATRVPPRSSPPSDPLQPRPDTAQ